MDSVEDDEIEAARVGATSFPRAIPEDTVEYSIYLLDKDDGISDIHRRDGLRKIQTASTALVKKHLRGHIWEADSFELNLAKQDNVSYLRGRTAYGDAIEDEWIIVWLLVELSKQFKSAWIRVSDTDGEFLLIEAANSLPKWLNPEVADHRVWINQGHLKIIPKSNKHGTGWADYAGSLTMCRAMEFLKNQEALLWSDSKIETEAFYRIKNYPARIADTLHHALVRIPRKLAFVLNKSPSYISSAIDAFYLRDPIALKPLQALTQQQLIFPPQDLISCRIKFTRVGFAKLRSQQFTYPPTWTLTEPTSQDAKVSSQADMGMKLTCGFEMLLADPQNQDKKIVREIKLILEDLEADEESLLTDAEIQAWGITEDSDSWLDINYQDFEQELAGKTRSTDPAVGFGNIDTQEKLRKMVSRFEDLMAEDDDSDDMDQDNDSDVEEPESDVESTKSAEEDFNEMMREMLGMSKETMDELMGKIKREMESKDKGKEPQIIEEDSDDDEEEIRKLSQAMEAELRASGALKFNDGKENRKLLVSTNAGKGDGQDELSDEEYLDEDFNLAKNMMESFKSQAGTAGPAGNLMGLMGMNLPRDEDDDG